MRIPGERKVEPSAHARRFVQTHHQPSRGHTVKKLVIRTRIKVGASNPLYQNANLHQNANIEF